METVATELDPFILAAAGLAILLLIAVLIRVSQLISSNKQVLENQKNQNNLLMTISNVLSSNAAGANPQTRTEPRVSGKPTQQDFE